MENTGRCTLRSEVRTRPIRGERTAADRPSLAEVVPVNRHLVDRGETGAAGGGGQARVLPRDGGEGALIISLGGVEVVLHIAAHTLRRPAEIIAQIAVPSFLAVGEGHAEGILRGAALGRAELGGVVVLRGEVVFAGGEIGGAGTIPIFVIPLRMGCKSNTQQKQSQTKPVHIIYNDFVDRANACKNFDNY